MNKYLLLTCVITAIIAAGIVIAVEFALSRVLTSGDIISAGAIGLGSAVSTFIVFKSYRMKSCRK